jgi:hypothetical protein
MCALRTVGMTVAALLVLASNADTTSRDASGDVLAQCPDHTFGPAQLRFGTERDYCC